MNLTIIDPNKTLVTLCNETQILYSYNTPVVVRLPEGTFLKTNAKYSKATQKHINSFLVGEKAYEVPQSEINAFVENV